MGPSPILKNAGNATLQGIEVEAQAALVGGFGFYFAAGYIDAEYDDVNETVVGITTDSELPKTPEYKVNFGPTFDFNLANGGAMRLALDYTYTAELFNDSLNTANLKRPSVDNLNAAIRYQSPGRQVRVRRGRHEPDRRALPGDGIHQRGGGRTRRHVQPAARSGTRPSGSTWTDVDSV